MITTAEILSIAYDGNDCRVRIPLFETASSIIRTSIPAKFTSVPGIYNNYKVGDYVWVAFDRDLFGYPVVIGKIYNGGTKERNEIRGTANFESLKVTGSVSLPKDTTITLSNGMTVSLNSFFTDNTGAGAQYRNITVEGNVKSYEVIISIYNVTTKDKYTIILNTHNEYTEGATGCANFLKRIKDSFNDISAVYPVASYIGAFSKQIVGAYVINTPGSLGNAATHTLYLVTKDNTTIPVLAPNYFSQSLIHELTTETDIKYFITDFKCIETTNI